MKLNKKIDIAMTSVIRPKIVKRTLETFTKRVFKEKGSYRLIINIDVVGENHIPQVVLEMCYKFFNRKNVIYNISPKPSFPNAVIWAWNQVESDYFFHLEDDWQIFRDVDISRLIRIMKKNNSVASIRFCNRKLKSYTKRIVEVSGLFFDVHDGFCISKSPGNSFSLNPSLIRTSFMKEALPLMRRDVNPEKQFRRKDPILSQLVMKWDYAIYGNPGDHALVDGKRGRYWREKMGYNKPSKNQFLSWEGV